jgi:hypothetical protein
MGMVGNARRIIIWEPLRTLETCEDNINMHLRVTGCANEKWIELGQDHVQ